MNFSKINLCEQIVDILQSFGFKYPTEVQQKSIPVILMGNDVIIRSETGSGKTFAFVLPILQNIDIKNKNIQALVLCPTRELTMQVADETRKIAEPMQIDVCAVFGGSNIDRQIKSLKKEPQIVIGTTGRVMDLIKRKALKIESAKFLVLDEADEMLDMGFRSDIEMIMGHTQKHKQTLLFSATMPNEIKELATKYQKNPILVEIGKENKALDKINQYYIYVAKKNKKQVLLELFYSDIYKKTIVFVNTKSFAEDIESFLRKNKVSAKALHGDMRQNERKRVLNEFKNEKTQILVATDVAARGLDINDVEYVINFDLPHELEFYVHRIGRTARAGKSGFVINLITSLEQFSQMRDIEKQTNAKIDLYETESENLKQYFVDTKKLAKARQKTASTYTKQNNKKYKNDKKQNTHNSFEEQFSHNKQFKRFATFDYFDDFYGDEYKEKTENKFAKKITKNKNKIKKSKFDNHYKNKKSSIEKSFKQGKNKTYNKKKR